MCRDRAPSGESHPAGRKKSQGTDCHLLSRRQLACTRCDRETSRRGDTSLDRANAGNEVRDAERRGHNYHLRSLRLSCGRQHREPKQNHERRALARASAACGEHFFRRTHSRNPAYNAGADRRIAPGARVAYASRVTDASCDRCSD